MTIEAAYVALLVVLALGLLITGKASLEFIGLLLLPALVIPKIVHIDLALRGFGSSTVVMLAGLYVIAEGLTRTGAVNFVANFVLRLSGGRSMHLLFTLCTAAALLSAFASNTAVMLVLIPLAIGLSVELAIPVSRLLMPMAFASIFGGTITLVGSSINILTSGVAVENGADAIGMFEMTPIGLPLAIIGVTLTVFLAHRSLPDRHSLTTALAAAPSREYVTELTVGANSSLAGKTVSQAFADETVRPLFLVRDDDAVPPPIADAVLQTGDIVVLQGDVNRIVDLQERLRLGMVEDTRFDPRTMSLFEIAVSPGSHLVGRRMRELHLWRDFEMLLVAVLRGGRHIRERATELVLRSGDVLLVCAGEGAQSKLRASVDFYLLSEGERQVVLRKHARWALGILALVVVMFGLGSVPGVGEMFPLPLVAMLGGLGMVVTRCVTPRRAYQSIDWPILLFIVGALALGHAMDSTGLAKSCADAVVGLAGPLGPAALTSGLLLIGTVLNQLTSPYAVTAILTPIALETARVAGYSDLRPFILAIAFAGSNAFATPFGHQVNLMVMGPGGYRYTDFMRLGLPLCLFFWVFVSIALALMGSN